jgi:hypothetical protein
VEGVDTNAPLENWIDGISGTGNQALNFDGINDYLMINNLAQSLNQTILFWFKTSNIPPNGRPFGGIISHTNNADAYHILQLSNGPARVYRRISGDWRYISSLNNITDNNWHNIIAVYDNTTIRFYLDGALQGSGFSADETVFMNSSWTFGRYGPSDYFKGIISDVRIYDTALTAEEVGRIYAETKDKYLVYE